MTRPVSFALVISSRIRPPDSSTKLRREIDTLDPTALALEVRQALVLELVVDAVSEVEDEALRDSLEDPRVQRPQRLADQVDREKPEER